MRIPDNTAAAENEDQAGPLSTCWGTWGADQDGKDKGEGEAQEKLPRSAIHPGQLEVSSHGLNDLEDRHNEREGTSRNEESTYSTR